MGMTEIVNIDASDKRRTWGLILLAGGGMSMTGYASVVLYLVRENADYAFYLGLCAMALIGIVLTGFAGLLVKRTIRANIVGNELEISDMRGDEQ
jgi:hypothetical protein